MKIFAVGMNYASHNEEMKRMDFHVEEPVIFTKADSALLNQGKPFFVPDWTERVDYEAELVVRICRLGKSIPERFAYRYYDAVTVGIDFTARDMQQQAKSKGLPWAICKGFDGSAVIGEWVAIRGDRREEKPEMNGNMVDMENLHFHLDLNEQTVQRGCSADMIYSVDRLISYISRFFTLRTGDLLYTGTPAGVGPVKIGDHLQGYLEGRKVLDFYCR
ncbi:MAG: fumarylacetoacetate hydrolase family protein [Prevotella sp.]|nr:fumarylacetoacetate hydrolase family protein [Prevotella sp.]